MYDEKYELNWSKIASAINSYKKTGIAAGLLVASGFVFGNKMLFPDEYEASALVRVQISEALRSGVAGGGRDAVVQVVREEILSRTVLETVAKNLGMDQPSIRDKTVIQKVVELVTGQETAIRPQSMDNIVRDLRTNVTITEMAAGASGGANVFMIGMKSKYPDEVSKIVNSVVETYIHQKTNFKATDSQHAVEFLTSQVEQKRQDLLVVTRKLEMYKGSNSKFLVTDAAASQALLEARRRLIDIESRLTQANALLETNEAAMRTLPATLPTPAAARPAVDPNNLSGLSPQERLAYLEQVLSEYGTRYTDTHPDVVRTRREVEKLKASLGPRSSNESTTVIGTPNPEYWRLRSEITTTRASQQAANAELVSVRREIAELEGVSARLPQVQQVLAGLENSRDSIQREYQDLQTRLTDARLNVQAAHTDVGVNFKIVDPAVTPVSPVIRSRLILHVFGVFLGTGVAVGLSLLLGLTMKDKGTMNILINEDGSVTTSTESETKTIDLVFYVSSGLLLVCILGYIAVDVMMQMVMFVE